MLLEGLSGAVDLEVTGKEDADAELGRHRQSRWRGLGRHGYDGRLIDLYDTPRAEGSVAARVNDLSVLSELIERPVGGRGKRGSHGQHQFRPFRLQHRRRACRIGSEVTGMVEVDRLLVGDTTLGPCRLGVDGRTDPVAV